MPDFTFLHGLSTVAIGGLIAAVVAGWKQVKGFFAQIASLVVVTANIDSRIASSVYIHLRQKYKIVPSGIHRYVSRHAKIKGDAFNIPIPYHLPNSTAIYVSKRGVPLIVSHSDSMQIRGLRGTINFKKLIAQATNEMRERNNSGSSRKAQLSNTSRFQVYKVMGAEKYVGDMQRKKQGTLSASEGDPVPDSIDSSSSNIGVNLLVDKSWMFSQDDFEQASQEDPLRGLYFEPHVLEHFQKARRWMEMGKWYSDRNIPWRRGWLLHGPGGTGKSSIARGLAITLGIPVYQFYLGTLSDQEFAQRWSNMSTPCVALFEDFDNIFHGREPVSEHTMLSFDTVLNHISGVDSTDGVFLVVTTNCLDKIDPAMGVSHEGGSLSTRPGRIDTVIEVGLMDEACRRALVMSILRDWPDLVEHAVGHTFGMTPSQVQEYCVQQAFERLDQEEKARPKEHGMISEAS